MSTGEALAFLDRKIAELRTLPEVIKALGPEAAAVVKATIGASLAAGKSPDGAVWAPRKEDGGRPYANAASRLVVKASGTTITALMTGPEVYGHKGVRGAKPRPMLPTGITAALAAALTKLALERIQKHFR